MKAVALREFGGPEVLRLEEVAEPRPGPGEVLVRVRACSVNHRDVWMRQSPWRVPRLPYILGSDIAGEVAAVGAGVTDPKPGAAVVVSPNCSCRRCLACLSGRQSYCPRYAILDGGYAELACVPAVNCHPLPTGLSWAEAAAIPLVFITAWHMLVDRAAIRPGETVLVWGAGSGVGSAAVQIARHFGCQVVAVVGADWKVARARELGLRALRAGGGTSTAA